VIRGGFYAESNVGFCSNCAFFLVYSLVCNNGAMTSQLAYFIVAFVFQIIVKSIAANILNSEGEANAFELPTVLCGRDQVSRYLSQAIHMLKP
jgi:hypothetical protein